MHSEKSNLDDEEERIDRRRSSLIKRQVMEVDPFESVLCNSEESMGLVSSALAREASPAYRRLKFSSSGAALVTSVAYFGARPEL